MLVRSCTHLSRAQVESVAEPTGAALVSITDPGSRAVVLHPAAWVEVLAVGFHDVVDDHEEVLAWGQQPPQARHAEEIAAFAARHRHRSIVVHCEAGVSRSAAVCAVLAEWGWRYRVPNATGLSKANKLLLRLLRVQAHTPAA